MKIDFASQTPIFVQVQQGLEDVACTAAGYGNIYRTLLKHGRKDKTAFILYIYYIDRDLLLSAIIGDLCI